MSDNQISCFSKLSAKPRALPETKGVSPENLLFWTIHKKHIWKPHLFEKLKGCAWHPYSLHFKPISTRAFGTKTQGFHSTSGFPKPISKPCLPPRVFHRTLYSGGACVTPMLAHIRTMLSLCCQRRGPTLDLCWDYIWQLSHAQPMHFMPPQGP